LTLRKKEGINWFPLFLWIYEFKDISLTNVSLFHFGYDVDQINNSTKEYFNDICFESSVNDLIPWVIYMQSQAEFEK